MQNEAYETIASFGGIKLFLGGLQMDISLLMSQVHHSHLHSKTLTRNNSSKLTFSVVISQVKQPRLHKLVITDSVKL